MRGMLVKSKLQRMPKQAINALMRNMCSNANVTTMLQRTDVQLLRCKIERSHGRRSHRPQYFLQADMGVLQCCYEGHDKL